MCPLVRWILISNPAIWLPLKKRRRIQGWRRWLPREIPQHFCKEPTTPRANKNNYSSVVVVVVVLVVCMYVLRASIMRAGDVIITNNKSDAHKFVFLHHEYNKASHFSFIYPREYAIQVNSDWHPEPTIRLRFWICTRRMGNYTGSSRKPQSILLWSKLLYIIDIAYLLVYRMFHLKLAHMHIYQWASFKWNTLYFIAPSNRPVV